MALSAFSRWEIRYGLALLPEGKRRDDPALRFDGLVGDLFCAGVYGFTSAAAERCASIRARKRSMGESLDGEAALTPFPQSEGPVKDRLAIALRRMPSFEDWLV